MHLAEITLASQRPAQQRRFYAEALGLEAGAAGDVVRVRAGAGRLVFVPGAPSPQHIAFRIPSAAYADALAWLGERAELLTGADGSYRFAFPDWNADAMYFRDPDGNVLELIAHHGLPEPYEPPFAPDTLLGVCEVGMPADDVAAFLVWLEGRAGARRWSGDGVSFAAAGDKRGSLIVVPRGRAWHPVPGAEAVAGPIGIELGDGAGQLL
jgi:catechol 2,3-dioxygenase-like lactoylglutathione lyase family enzyme